jgi:hypothetical protein
LRRTSIRPSRRRFVAWLFTASLCAAIAAVPVAAFARPASPGRSAAAHQKAQPHTANSHAFKDTSAGSWGPNGHQPAESSFPQGYSPSDPDGTTNGGPDKPGEVGGFNDDKDGNNGCGNDSDREDDNNGWCGRKPAPSVTPTVAPSVAPTETEASGSPAGEVLGEIVQRTPSVLGVQLSRTGAPVLTAVAIGMLMVIAGVAMRLTSRRATRAVR